MTTALVVQARTGSSRLPGKVLLPLAGAPLLSRMVERLRAITTPVELVVATTWETSDDPIERLCRDIDIRCFRGHPTDCLNRHLGAAQAVGADTVVKIPSDCPLIDPSIVDRVLAVWAGEHYDYLSNLHPPSWPDGQDVEVMTMAALTEADRVAEKPLEREHTTPFFWEQPERFRVGNVSHTEDLYSHNRWVIDYPEDYTFLQRVFDALYQDSSVFSVEDVLGLLRREPELRQINARYGGVNWYRHHLNELKTVGEKDTRSAPGEMP